MKKNLSIVRMMLAAIVFSTCAPSLKAQSGVVVNVGADLVSGYVWRGVYQIGSGRVFSLRSDGLIKDFP